jgi:6-phosphogluconate dehydrogenase
MANEVGTFIKYLKTPRAVMLLVPAGPIVDSVIRDLMPYLDQGDLIIDAGNSHFKDTDLREKTLEAKGLYFTGMGISGGESGARYGPSMMPGGSQAAYLRVQPIMEAAAAKVNDEPCVTYLGPHSAGHYVKMVHNGIEYGLMQLIAEIYDLLRRGMGISDDRMGDLFDQWNKEELNSYLVEITADIFRRVDEVTGRRLVDVVLDAARQLGTGMWTSQDALSLHVPTPTIDIAVAMRNLSGLEDEREEMARKYDAPAQVYQGKSNELILSARSALYAAMILTYSQGFAQLGVASETYGYNLDLSAVGRIWRGGCIIRSALLEPIVSAYQSQPKLHHLLLDKNLGSAVIKRLADLQHVVQTAVQLSIPVPAFMASLAYFESLRATHLPANLIQAQRDYFGAHTYERVDQRGVFHTQW